MPLGRVAKLYAVTSLVSPSSPRTSWRPSLRCSWKARPLLPQSVTGKPGRSFTRVTALALETVEILEWVARRGRRADGKERARRIPAAGCNERATHASCPSASRPTGLRRFWRWPALLAGPRSLRISALRSRLGQRQNRQQRGPLQYFNSLLKRSRRPVIGHVFLHGHARNGAADHVESQVLQRFEADATLESPAVCSHPLRTHVELLAALLVFAGEPG